MILVDIICHGVPSKKVWDRYINWKNSKEGKKVKKVNFRNKKNGWKKYNMALEYEDSTDEYISHSDDLFFNAYLDNIILRPSCYSCLFKGFNRNSDITLGDCWGINSICERNQTGCNLYGGQLLWCICRNNRAKRCWSRHGGWFPH